MRHAGCCRPLPVSDGMPLEAARVREWKTPAGDCRDGSRDAALSPGIGPVRGEGRRTASRRTLPVTITGDRGLDAVLEMIDPYRASGVRDDLERAKGFEPSIQPWQGMLRLPPSTTGHHPAQGKPVVSRSSPCDPLPAIRAQIASFEPVSSPPLSLEITRSYIGCGQFDRAVGRTLRRSRCTIISSFLEDRMRPIHRAALYVVLAVMSGSARADAVTSFTPVER